MTEVHKRKIGDALRGKKKSPEHCLKLSDAKKKNWQNSKYAKYMSEIHRGKKHSKEHCRKISVSNKGKHDCLHSEASIKKMAKSMSLSLTRKGNHKFYEPWQRIGNGRWYIRTEEGIKDYHRYVMEQYLGRKLLSGEYVHHKDENFSNNDILNLEIMSNVEHLTHHNKKSVMCVETRHIYDSLHDIERKTKINCSNLCAVLKGRQKTAGGYHWIYV